MLIAAEALPLLVVLFFALVPVYRRYEFFVPNLESTSFLGADWKAIVFWSLGERPFTRPALAVSLS